MRQKVLLLRQVGAGIVLALGLLVSTLVLVLEILCYPLFVGLALLCLACLPVAAVLVTVFLFL